MNVINKFFLKIALLPLPLYGRMGVNVAHLKAILTAKLTMDDRRPNTLQQTSRKKSAKPVKAATIGTIISSTVMGLIYLISFIYGSNTITQLTFYFSFFFFILAASLISDFTSVLIDVRDNYILLPKPVSDRTIVTARILHILIHICRLIVPMSLPGAVYMFYNHGAWGGLCFLLMAMLLTLFVIFFINALYILMLRITTPARFQAIISYVQIGFAIAIYASYQVLPRLADRFGALHFDATQHPILFALPMYWFATAWQTLYTFHASPGFWAVLLLVLLLPVACLYVVVRYLAPAFNNKLSLLNSVDAETAQSAGARKQVRAGYAQRISRLVTARGPERMGFLFTWKLMARSRDFKVKVYPSLGYMLVIVILFFVRRTPNPTHPLPVEGIRVLLISALYISSFVLITAINQLTQSDKFKASWIFFTTPLHKPGAVIRGALLASFVKFFFPVLAIVCAVALYLLGWDAVPNIILGICNQLLFTALLIYVNYRVFPFSLPQNNNTRSGAFLKNMFLFALEALMGWGHFLVYNITVVVFIFIALSAIATWMMLGSIRDTPWPKIQRAYAAV